MSDAKNAPGCAIPQTATKRRPASAAELDRRAGLVGQPGRPDARGEDGSERVPATKLVAGFGGRRGAIHAGEDESIGAAESGKGLAKAARGGQVTAPEGVARVEEEDVHVALEREVLVSVVEQEEVGAEVDGGPRRLHASLRHHDGDRRQPESHRDRLVAPDLRGDEGPLPAETTTSPRPRRP